MNGQKINGSSLQRDYKELNDSDLEENCGKTKVLIHQDAFDIPENIQKKDFSAGERPRSILNLKGMNKMCPNKIAEPDDVITPLSEESSPTVAGHHWEDKRSVELSDSETNGCHIRIFSCCGELVDPSSFTLGRLLGLILCFVFYVGNILSDIAVCYHLFWHGNMLWFALVSAFVVVPTVILNSISYHLSISKMIVKRSIWDQSESFVVSAVIAVLHLSQFGVFARYLGYIFLHELEYLWVIFCPNEKRKDFDHHSGKYVELPYLPYLFMVEAVFQCLPQLIVQLCVLIEGQGVLTADTNQMLIISIMITLLNLTRLLTLCKHVQKNFTTSWSGLFFLFLWYLFTNISRIVSFTLFLLKFSLGFLMLCLFHWIIMSVWAVSVLTPSVPCFTLNGLRKNCIKYSRGLLCGIMYLLCFMELKIKDDSEPATVPSRYLYIFFYSVIFLENSVLIVLWFVYCSSVWYSIPAIILVFISFFIGIFSMYVYYRYFHKNVISRDQRWQCVLLFPTRNRIV